MADHRSPNGGEESTGSHEDLAAQVPEERSIYDRGSAEEVVAAPPPDDVQGAPETGWREDVRVDPERQREILRPRSAGNEMRGRGGRDVNWRGEDDQWSALFRDDERARSTDAPRDDEAAGERQDGDAAGDHPLADRELQRAVAREPEVERDTSDEPEGLASSMLRGAVAGTLGALALAFASRGEDLSATRSQARGEETLEGVGLTLGFGALLGAVYGAVQSRWEPPALLHALALSGLSYAATASGDVKKADALLAERTGSGTVGDRLDGGDAHLAFGMTTAAAFDLLR